MTFNEIFPDWLRSKKLHVRESSVSLYVMNWINHLQPYWGEMEIESVRTRHLQDFVDEKIAAGSLSIKTIQDMVLVVKMIISWAQIRYELPVYPLKVVYPTSAKLTKRDLDVYTPREIEKIFRYIDDNPKFEYMGIALALTTGMRVGELCALQFSDIDFDHHRINITKTIERICVNYSGGKGTKIVIGPPKTPSSIRCVPLIPKLEKWYKAASKICKPDYYLLSGNAKFIESRTYRKILDRVCSAAGVHRMKFHGLRHTFATLLVQSSVDVRTVAAILGHSNIEITLNTYTHTNENMKDAATAKAFKGILNKSGKERIENIATIK